MRNLKQKAAAMSFGAFLGVSAILTGLSPVNHQSEAAIAVFDQRNIEEAIKTAIQTANILTNEEKQLLLQIVNSKKLDPKALLKIVQNNKREDDSICKIIYPKIGASKIDQTVDSVWSQRIGDIENVLNGNITVVDVWQNEKKREKLLHDTYLEAAKAAKEASIQSKQTMQDTQALVEASNSAEGMTQLKQIGNAIESKNVYAITRMTGVLDHLIAMEATKYEKEAMEELEKAQVAKQTQEEAQKYEDSKKRDVRPDSPSSIRAMNGKDYTVLH